MKVRTDWRVMDDLQKPAKQSTLTVLVAPPSRRESAQPIAVHAKSLELVRPMAQKKFARNSRHFPLARRQ
jgi:hypothetical protein